MPIAVQDHAQAALDAAVKQDTERANRAVQAMLDEHGPDSIVDATIHWVELTLAAIPEASTRGALRVGNVDGTSYNLVDVDQLAPPVRWACRVYSAQANHDFDLVADLWDSLSPVQYAASASALLYVCACTLRNRELLAEGPLRG